MDDSLDKQASKRIQDLVRAKYERLCDLFEAAVPMGVGKKLYTKEIISSDAHRSLDTLGISKSQQARKLMDAVMLTLRADDTDETFMAFLDVLRSVSGPCRRLADKLYTEYTGNEPPPPAQKSNPDFVDCASKVTIDVPFRLGTIMEELSRLDFPMAEWRMLGLSLGITQPILQAIAMDRGTGNQKNSLIDMLSTWLRQDVTASWEKLAAGLRKIAFNTIAVQVENKRGRVSNSDLGEIMVLLAENDFDESCWQMLGLMLGIRSSVLQGIDANHGGGRPNAQVHSLMDTIARWLRQDSQASWGKLIASLEKCGHTVVADKLKNL